MTHDVAHSGVSRDRYNPIKTIKTSFIGTMNMLGLAKRTKARFLLTSTSEVYGDPLVHPQVRCLSFQYVFGVFWDFRKNLVQLDS